MASFLRSDFLMQGPLNEYVKMWCAYFSVSLSCLTSKESFWFSAFKCASGAGFVSFFNFSWNYYVGMQKRMTSPLFLSLSRPLSVAGFLVLAFGFLA